MDPLLTELTKFGAAGVLMAIICSAAVLLLRNQIAASQKTSAESLQLVRDQIEERKQDLAWARGEIVTSRNEFIEALKQTNSANLIVLARVEQRWEKSSDSICSRLESIEKKLNS